MNTFKLIALAAATALLTACSPGLDSLSSLTTGYTSRSSDAAALGGLSDAKAAHPSVQLNAPAAYALSPQAPAFLEALERVVVPQRQTLLERLQADATVTQGLANWERSGSAKQLTVLKRIAAIQGEVMDFEVPPIVQKSGQPAQSGLMAYFQVDTDGTSQVILYSDQLAREGKYMAVSALVHELRHAAQYQMMQANSRLLSTLDADERTLATAYAASWQVVNNQGAETALAYGDYAHLNVEYDAFQTGNAIAAQLSAGQYDALGFGFVDTHYDAHGEASLDLLALSREVSGSALIAAVNQAEAKTEKGRTVPDRMGTIQRPSHGFARPAFPR